ncbi:hypothetical protein TNCV_1871291 [Trichonephila clavipes]|nr:hypothetical protein TNCV_1871291 [Trichonephila clavipes]
MLHEQFTETEWAKRDGSKTEVAKVVVREKISLVLRKMWNILTHHWEERLSTPALHPMLGEQGAFGEIFGHMTREASLHPISGIVDVERQWSFHASM